ncbi:MAG: class I SAM-dependent methyltransferase [Pirellulales bacterium]
MKQFFFNARHRRVDWLFNQYADASIPDKKVFVQKINQAYYAQSTRIYGDRFVDDIEASFKSMCQKSGLQKDEGYVVINIGGGTGFEYEQLKRNSIRWSKYIFIEPDPQMAKAFQERFKNDADRPKVLKGTLSKHLQEVASYKKKLIVICSCLHHVIWIEEFLDQLKQVMQSGDRLVLAHEPNNSYLGSVFMIASYAWRILTTDVLWKRLGFWKSKAAIEDARRWQQINKELVAESAVTKELPPIVIRRLIDYWVGTKGDWKAMGVPKESDEGFWKPEDIKKYLGEEFDITYFQTYRHLGDPGTRGPLQFINRTFSRIFMTGGSVFNLVLQRI